MSVPSLNLVNW